MNRDPGVEERTPRPLTDEVRYAGEAVAVVVADDPYRVADAAEAADVVYDELPAVVDPAEALREGAPLIHPDVPANVAGRLSFAMGDIHAAFAQADVTISISTPPKLQAPRSSRGAWSPSRAETTAWRSRSGSQRRRPRWSGGPSPERWSFAPIKCALSGLMSAPASDPRGARTPKRLPSPRWHLQLGRPCCWEATRQEDFQSTYHGQGLSIDAELAARSDGSILGLRALIVQDVGSYLLAVLIVPQYAAEHLIGPYHVPAADVQAVGVYTNKASLTPVRGGGREQGVFVIERLLDHLARKIGIDPLDVRRRNTLRREEFPYDTRYPKRYGGTIVYDSGDFASYLEEVRELIGYDEVRRAQTAERIDGKYRGVAVTLFAESTAMGKEGARVEVADDGSVSLAVGSADTGQGHRTTMAQICASELGVAADRICFVSGDTRAMGVGTGTFASRFAVMAGNATALAARQGPPAGRSVGIRAARRFAAGARNPRRRVPCKDPVQPDRKLGRSRPASAPCRHPTEPHAHLRARNGHNLCRRSPRGSGAGGRRDRRHNHTALCRRPRLRKDHQSRSGAWAAPPGPGARPR
jgi:aerobic carbon-monoxide dehydrogenase large subunit